MTQCLEGLARILLNFCVAILILIRQKSTLTTAIGLFGVKMVCFGLVFWFALATELFVVLLLVLFVKLWAAKGKV